MTLAQVRSQNRDATLALRIVSESAVPSNLVPETGLQAEAIHS